MEVAEQVLMIKGASEGMLDDFEVDQVQDFEQGFLEFIRGEYKELIEELNDKKILGDDGDAKFKEAVKRFCANFAEANKAETAAAGEG